MLYWHSILYSYLSQERLGRAFLETMRNEYAELLKKISETEVEQWTRLVEEEREHVGFSIARAKTNGMKVHQRAREHVTEHDQILKHTLAEFKTPIVQMSDQISIIHDTFNSKIHPITRLTRLCSSVVRRRAEKGVPLDVGDRL